MAGQREFSPPPALCLAGLLCLLQVLPSFCEAPSECRPGFSSNEFVFTTERKELKKDKKLGTVDFVDCTPRKHSRYDVGDPRFLVMENGSLIPKRHVKLHGNEIKFPVTTWDAQGNKYSATVMIKRLQRSEEKNHLTGRHPLLIFPERQTGIKRRKRDWVVPPIQVSENNRGPFPKRVIQIKSSKNVKTFYSITGQGADTPPVGIFTIEKETGWLLVTGPLDRERYASYQLQSHAVSESGQQVEEPMDIVVDIIDQNDNRPKFTQEIFRGFVREGVQPGTPVMHVTATDVDDPLTANAILGYSILKQIPEDPMPGLFTINKLSGLISVIDAGLDREKVQKYTLIVQAADWEGDGLTATATAVIQITDSNDNAPVFDPVKETAGANPSLLTTHVLNIAQGIPAKGLTLTLSKFNAKETKWEHLSQSVTDQDGRCPGLLRGEPLTAGTFQLRFDTGEYWKLLKLETFYPYAEVVFNIADPKEKYHVPLLISPFSYSTYRGS